MRIGIVILPEHRWWAAEPKWRALDTMSVRFVQTARILACRNVVK